jgi:hypothetical protein
MAAHHARQDAVQLAALMFVKRAAATKPNILCKDTRP